MCIKGSFGKEEWSQTEVDYVFTYHLPLRVLLPPEGGEWKIEPTII